MILFKKTPFILLFSLLFCLSCNKNDDSNGNTFKEKLIGSWQLSDRKIDNVPETLSICEKKSIVQFHENGDLETMLFAGDDSDNCQSFNTPGTWTYNGNNEITTDITGQTSVSEVVFSNNDMTLKVTSTNEGKSIEDTYEKQ